MSYYDTSYPPSLWAPKPPPVIPATGANAGIPGVWTPANSDAPRTVADLQAGNPNAVIANPLTAWTTGQYVQTKEAGSTGQAHWTGTVWIGGIVAEVEEPQTFTAIPVDEVPQSDE